MIKKALTLREAREYLGISEYSFEQEIKRGNISYKQVGRIRLFPIWVLDKWLNDTQSYTAYSSAVTPTMRTFRAPSQDSGCELEKLATQLLKKWQTNTASKELRSYSKRPKTKPTIDCLV